MFVPFVLQTANYYFEQLYQVFINMINMLKDLDFLPAREYCQLSLPIFSCLALGLCMYIPSVQYIVHSCPFYSSASSAKSSFEGGHGLWCFGSSKRVATCPDDPGSRHISSQRCQCVRVSVWPFLGLRLAASEIIDAVGNVIEKHGQNYEKLMKVDHDVSKTAVTRMLFSRLNPGEHDGLAAAVITSADLNSSSSASLSPSSSSSSSSP